MVKKFAAILLSLLICVSISTCQGSRKEDRAVQNEETASPLPSPFNRERLEEAFATMHQCGINTDDELLWGYFFMDRDSPKLEAAVPYLKKLGYCFVEIHQSDAYEWVSWV